MSDVTGGPWGALRRAYAPAQRVGTGHAVETRALPPETRPAPEGKGLGDNLETRNDLAEERAAILEFEGRLKRARAEVLAYRAHGLPAPKR